MLPINKVPNCQNDPCSDAGEEIYDRFATLMDGPNYVPMQDEARFSLESLTKKDYPSPTLLRAIRKDQIEHAHASYGDFGPIWDRFVAQFFENSALAAFENCYGSESQYFIPWQLHINTRKGADLAFGYSYNFKGQFNVVDRKDPIFNWVLADPVCIYARERAVRFARELRPVENILFLGGDPDHLGWKWAGLNEEGKKYSYASEDGKRYGAIVINSRMASQLLVRKDDGEIDGSKLFHIINTNIGRLKEGGVLLFDMLLDHWALNRNRKIFGWNPSPTVVLLKGADAANDLITGFTRNQPVSVNMTADSRNERPVGVMFALRKV